jgi:ribosomal protein S18 acetylase RimI-like enzyme
MHRALETAFERLYSGLDGARFERRADLIVAVYPPFPIPQFNGAWVVADSNAAIGALTGAIAEVEAAGAQACVQTRTGHDRIRQAARALGLTHTERLPGMAMRPGELAPVTSTLEVGLIRPEDTDATNAILAASFDAPKELFERFSAMLAYTEGVSWYVGRVEGEIVSTAVGYTVDGAIGVFNVATPPSHRGCGYGAALTSRVVTDGFSAGSSLAYLQSSDIGHGVYRRLGFRDVEEYLLLTRPKPEPESS